MTRDLVLLPGIEALRVAVLANIDKQKPEKQKADSNGTKERK